MATGAKTPILHGVAQGDIDMAGWRLLNLDLSQLASGAPFIDDTALLKSSSEPTALAHFKLSWTTPGVHRTFELPNYNATLATVDGVEDLTNKSINGITLTGTGGFTLTDAIVSLTGGLITNGDLDLGSGHELRIDTTGDTFVTLPVAGTLATTAQLPVISDVAYDATTWNGNLDGATKNALRDKFESLTSLQPPFLDDIALIANSVDPTKLIKFSAAALSSAGTRTFTLPDKNGTVATLDDLPFTAGILFGSDEDGRSLSLAGDVAFYGTFTVAGGFPILLNGTAVTELTLPIEGTLATWAGAETLTNKTIIGGSVTQLTGLSLRSTLASYDMLLATASSLSSNRTLTLNIADKDTTLSLGGNLTTSGDFNTTLTVTGNTALTLPTAGTLATLAGVETFTNKEILGGTAISIETLSILQFGSPYSLELFSNGDMGADRALSISVDGADRAVVLAGDLTLANNFTTSGDFALTLTQTGATNVTLPTTGLLASWVAVPATASSTGITGQMAYQTGFLYVCIAPSEWQRAVLASW
jgi:hypothetical protein